MTIPKDQLDKWKSLRSKGDGVAMMKDNPKLYPNAISRAFKFGECPDNVYDIMAAYYKKKSEKVKNMAI